MIDQKCLNLFAFVQRNLESYLLTAFFGCSSCISISYGTYTINTMGHIWPLNNPLVLYRLAISQTMIPIALHKLYLIGIEDRSYQGFSIIYFSLTPDLEMTSNTGNIFSDVVPYFETDPFLVFMFWLNSTASTYIFIARFTLFLV